MISGARCKGLILFFLLAVLIALNSSPIAGDAASSGLVAYYPFDSNNANDASGNGHDGIVGGGTVWKADGKRGGAFEFVTRSVTGGIYTDGTPFNFGTGDFTFSLWTYPYETAPFHDSDCIIISRYVYLDLRFWRGGLGADVSQWQSGPSDNSGTPINLNEWIHIVLKRQGSTVSLYKNGVLVGENQNSGSISSDYQLVIGDGPGGITCGSIWGPTESMCGYNGMIDELKIYNRALSEEEIQAEFTGIPLYTAECGNNITDEGEQCDGTDLGGKTCQDVGDYDSGTLGCYSSSCTFDLSNCISEPPPPPPPPQCYVYDYIYDDNASGNVSAGLFSILSKDSALYACSIVSAFPGLDLPNVLGAKCSDHYYVCANKVGIAGIAECMGESSSNNPDDDSIKKSTGGSITNPANNKNYYCSLGYRWETNLDQVDDYSSYNDPHGETCEAAGLDWTGEYCCGEADDVDIGESYSDPGGSGVCFLNNYFSNNHFFNPTGYHEYTEVFIYDGTMHGCAIDHLSAGGNNSYNDTHKSLSGGYEGTASTSNNWLLSFHDIPDPGGNPFDKGVLIKDKDYCSIIGASVGASVGTHFCSYQEIWLPTDGQNRNHLSYIRWLPAEPETAQDAECCQVNQCWDGTQCVDSVSVVNPNKASDIKHGKYICIDGKWQDLIEKYNWDRSMRGFCLHESQCLVNPSSTRSPDSSAVNPQCINDSMFIRDYYCDNGEWTTRTNLLAQHMLEMKENHDYTLFCGNWSKVVNYCRYQLTETPYFQADACEILLGGYTSGIESNNCRDLEGNQLPCVNNVCLLRYDDDNLAGSYDKVVVGMSLNQPVDSSDNSILKMFNAGRTACNGALGAGNRFAACNSSNELFFNPHTKSIVFVKTTVSDTSWFSNLLGTIGYYMKSLVKWVSGTGYHLTEFIDFTSMFNEFYMSEQGSHFIFGVKERKYDWNRTAFVDYVTMEFYGFANDLCENTIVSQGDPKTACEIIGAKQRIFGFNEVGAAPNQIVDNWITLTSKLRIGKEGSPSFKSNINCVLRTTSCNSGELNVFSMSAGTNAYAEVVDARNPGTQYNYFVCCKNTTAGIGELGYQCDDSRLNTKIIRLASVSNASGEVNYLDTQSGGSSAYPEDVCLSAEKGTVTCTYFEESCDPGYECLASISDETNAKFGECRAYDKKICCSVKENFCTVPGAVQTIECGYGICSRGEKSRTCDGTSWGAWSSCSTEGLAVNETCNGLDDNCDNRIDKFVAPDTGCPEWKVCSEGQCVKVACYQNSDCGAPYRKNTPYCSNNDKYDYKITPTCLNPGTASASCTTQQVAEKRQECYDNYCNSWGDSYCKDNDVYHSRTCYNKGCLGGSCYSSSSIQEGLVTACTYGCSEGVCTVPPPPPTCSGDLTQSCTVAHGSGTQIRTCLNGTWSSWGSCIISQCDAMFHIAGNTCVFDGEPLGNNVPKTGLSGIKGSESYYMINIPAGASNLVVNISGGTGGTGDADIYVKYGAPPVVLTRDYDCRPYRKANEEQCYFNNPHTGAWYIDLRGYKSYSGVTLKASYDS